MQDGLDITTVIFLSLAVFVIWRLFLVLGQKNDTNRSRFKPNSSLPEQLPNASNRDEPSKSISKHDETSPALAPNIAGTANVETRLRDTSLDIILQHEPEFNKSKFLEGARAAYEAIVVGFAKGDKQTLRSLLSKDVVDGFERAILEREKKNEVAETTFVSIDKSEISNVELRGKVAYLTVRFVSKLINVLRDSSRKIVDGSAETVVEVTDVWTFARTLGSRDPNWRLVATDGSNDS